MTSLFCPVVAADRLEDIKLGGPEIAVFAIPEVTEIVIDGLIAVFGSACVMKIGQELGIRWDDFVKSLGIVGETEKGNTEIKDTEGNTVTVREPLWKVKAKWDNYVSDVQNELDTVFAKQWVKTATHEGKAAIQTVYEYYTALGSPKGKDDKWYFEARENHESGRTSRPPTLRKKCKRALTLLDMEERMTQEHYYHRIDVENGYLQVTRDDTEETQELRINAYGKDGTLIKSARRLYNIKYDYFRYQTWKGGAPIQDEIPISYGYGHLQWEDVYGEKLFDEDWENPYPDNYEPLNPKGTYIFRHHGLLCSFSCIELDVSINARICNWEELDEDRKNGLTPLVKGVRPMNPTNRDREEEQEAIRKFDPKKAREERLKMLEINTQYLRCELEKPEYQAAVKAAHGKEIDIQIPYDPRFID
ncbi:unnamed protein product [Cylicocyclus nassatus]|uniref:Uncharacterized protein n=1 Tax=Cylicocyclus nassatus TaxID=53992 RepID=A0AA36DUP3_CYLNA|nr:unnamed protein product [Cylicocyclus nassatus]CAJ0592385.1 unnamed protein product [Cylicocyclus nassatus]